jgi:phosphoribosylformylglycinamidine synthase subunit PurS
VKARVHIFYKDSVFDPQGNTVAHSLQKMGFQKVKNVRIGKVVDLELSYQSPDEAKNEVRKMCEKLLANPVIESFKYELLDS